jgi:hypothetical protein
LLVGARLAERAGEVVARIVASASVRHQPTTPQETPMLKTIALAGIFMFSSAVSTTALTSTTQKKASSSQPAPATPAPKGFCLPLGSPC